jgi:hypothetical protein
MVVQTPAPSTFLRPEKTPRHSLKARAKHLSSEHRPSASSALHSLHLILFGGGLICSSMCILDTQSVPDHLAPKSPNQQTLLFMEWRCLQHAQAKLDAIR